MWNYFGPPISLLSLPLVSGTFNRKSLKRTLIATAGSRMISYGQRHAQSRSCIIGSMGTSKGDNNGVLSPSDCKNPCAKVLQSCVKRESAHQRPWKITEDAGIFAKWSVHTKPRRRKRNGTETPTTEVGGRQEVIEGCWLAPRRLQVSVLITLNGFGNMEHLQSSL